MEVDEDRYFCFSPEFSFSLYPVPSNLCLIAYLFCSKPLPSRVKREIVEPEAKDTVMPCSMYSIACFISYFLHVFTLGDNLYQHVCN